jgi:hypothetical protein
MPMKTSFLALSISTLLPILCAASDTNGFLVFKIERFDYGATNGAATNPEIKQSFKIPLSSEFFSNFKNLPTQHSPGTSFYCSSHFEKPRDGDPGFLWWLERTSDHRWYIHMWATFGNPAVAQSMTIKNLEDLDMSYENGQRDISGGVNVTFSAKYVSAEEMQREGPVLAAAVKREDQSQLFRGDILTNCPIALSGGFQD